MLRFLLKQIPATIAVILLLALATLFAVQNTNAKKKIIPITPEKLNTQNPVPATPQSISAGADLYKRYCKQCHGDNAKRKKNCVCTATFCPADLRDRQLWSKGEGFVYWTISDGRHPMPSFGKRLNEQQLWDLVNYLHSLVNESKTDEEKS